MATYAELRELKGNRTLRNAVEVACWVAAEAIRTESDTTDNHANRLIWAAAVFASPVKHASLMLGALLAANKDATVEAILSADDDAIQAKVDPAIDLFATGA